MTIPERSMLTVHDLLTSARPPTPEQVAAVFRHVLRQIADAHAKPTTDDQAAMMLDNTALAYDALSERVALHLAGLAPVGAAIRADMKATIAELWLDSDAIAEAAEALAHRAADLEALADERAKS